MSNVLFRAYRDVLVRIREQGENFETREAMDFLSRLADSGDVLRDQAYDMMVTVIRATSEFELDSDAERELELTEDWLAEQ